METPTSAQSLRHNRSLEEGDREGRCYDQACYYESLDTEDEQQVGVAHFYFIVITGLDRLWRWRVPERLEINV
jgi:hypothetical protein